jgi:hypothetical protein
MFTFYTVYSAYYVEKNNSSNGNIYIVLKFIHATFYKGWTVRGSNPGEDEIFRTCPDRLWGSPSLLYNRYRVFTEGKKRPGRDADP